MPSSGVSLHKQLRTRPFVHSMLPEKSSFASSCMIQNLEMKPEGRGLTVLVGMLLLTKREFELEKSSEADIFDVANTKILQ